MKVQDFMTRDVRACNRGTNLAQAATILWDTDCGSLPVVDESGKVVGLITDRDICIAVATRNRLASEIAAGEVVTGNPVYCCQPDDQVQAALAMMQLYQIRRLPIVDNDGRLQGILSINDIVRSAEDNSRSLRPGISIDDAIVTLKAICQPRAAEADPYTSRAAQI